MVPLIQFKAVSIILSRVAYSSSSVEFATGISSSSSLKSLTKESSLKTTAGLVVKTSWQHQDLKTKSSQQELFPILTTSNYRNDVKMSTGPISSQRNFIQNLDLQTFHAEEHISLLLQLYIYLYRLYRESSKALVNIDSRHSSSSESETLSEFLTSSCISLGLAIQNCFETFIRNEMIQSLLTRREQLLRLVPSFLLDSAMLWRYSSQKDSHAQQLE